jgi:hypothetical protein
VLPNTIDVAPSDGTRVYVSGRLGSADNYVSLLLRSNDAGQSFERTPAIPGTENLKYAYIAAVHPKNPDLVYVRVANLSGTVVLVSDDAGTSFTELFQTTGSALGFAVSDDELALGGPSDGIWTGDIMGAALERRSDVGPSCLAYGPAGLYACADAARDGFSLGVLRPNATSFEPLLDFATLCGPASCGSDTAVGTRCPYEWDNYLAERLGATCGGGSAGSDGAGGQGGADGGSATGGDAAGGDAAGGSTSGGSRSAGSGGSGRAAGPASSDEDGSCALVSSKARRPMLGIGALAFAVLAAGRRAVRRRRAPVRA